VKTEYPMKPSERGVLAMINVLRAVSVALLVILLGLAHPYAPPVQAGPAPSRGRTLTIAESADITNLDPALTGGDNSTAVKDLIYASLVDQTPTGEIRPDLAVSWKVNGTVWTLALRRGVKFQDGTPFNAQAVKAHYDRLFGPENPRRASDWRPFLDRVEVVDDYTIQFVTKYPDPFFLQRLAGSSEIESPDAFKKYGKDIARNPVGAGPFRLVEWTPDVRVVIARNDDYFGDKTYLDQVIFRPVPEAGARAIALESGDVQLADAISPEDMPRLRSNPNLTLDTVTTVGQLTVGMNNTKKPFNDVRVRQALNYAVDRPALARGVYQGLAEVPPGAVAIFAIGYAAVQSFPFDPAKAKELLAEAGYPNGFSATFMGTHGVMSKDFEMMQAIQQMLRRVGVTVSIQTAEWARYLQLVNIPPDKSPLELWLDGWADDNATNLLQQRFGCDFMRPKGVNLHGYCNPDVDALVTQAARTMDATQRNMYLKAAQTLIQRDAPSIWGLEPKSTAGLTRKLHGIIHAHDRPLTIDNHTWLEP
jgi:ABC-type transport system substrate-binding protein